ncbi:M14 family zinc carboxypeptidase [Nocardia sp. NPDC051990]|uniref:M14 family zinc carboxypeptidase n=1 Tax=Nocardia sp. NPDC051990 TaxID=3155285 RepID=UPI003429A33A
MIPEIVTILDGIPYQHRFPAPDEVSERLDAVAGRHPSLVRRRRVGTSRQGKPIDLVSIGSGPRDALVFAGPHPNEPVGFLTVPYLAELLCADDGLRERLGYTWHLMGCVDPDGAQLNEGWYAGPLTRRHYARQHYRPPFNEQVEWAFPLPGGSDAVLPETRALMHVIDTVRPELMCSLHNAEFGGVYYYLSNERPRIADALAELSARTGIPLHVGDAELPGTRPIRPGVFVIPSLESAHQAMTEEADGSMGASSVHYAGRHGTFSLIIEVPIWTNPHSADNTTSDQRRAEVLTATAGMLQEISPRIGEAIDPALETMTTAGSFFARSLADLRRNAPALAAALRHQARHAGDAVATVAERFAARQTAHTLRLRACGIALRLLDEQASCNNRTATLQDARRALDDLFTAWADEADAEAASTPVPLHRLLGAQLGAILTAAALHNEAASISR